MLVGSQILCQQCVGEGKHQCFECGGGGVIQRQCPRCLLLYKEFGLNCTTCSDPQWDAHVACPTCKGEGNAPCSQCEGTGGY